MGLAWDPPFTKPLQHTGVLAFSITKFFSLTRPALNEKVVVVCKLNPVYLFYLNNNNKIKRGIYKFVSHFEICYLFSEINENTIYFNNNNNNKCYLKTFFNSRSFNAGKGYFCLRNDLSKQIFLLYSLETSINSEDILKIQRSVVMQILTLWRKNTSLICDMFHASELGE